MTFAGALNCPINRRTRQAGALLLFALGMFMILLITKDLFFVPAIRSAAERQASHLQVALSHDSNKVTELSAEKVSAWILDLNSLTVGEIEGVVKSLSSSFPAARRVAFGPHVQTARLEAAARAGCEQVLSRGQLSSQIERLIIDWL